MSDDPNDRPRFRPKLMKNKALREPSEPLPSTSQGIQIKKEPNPDPEPVVQSPPVKEKNPVVKGFSAGISAAEILNYCSLIPKPTPPIRPPTPPISSPTPVPKKESEPEKKKPKSNENINHNEEREHQEYVRRVNEREKQNASEFLLRPSTRNEDSRMEVDNDTDSTCPTLDGVSTILDDDIQSLIDPNFQLEAEKFFRTRKNYDYDSAPLPIASKRKFIIDQVEVNRVVVIKGTTGCGKTTQVPQYIMEHCYDKKKHFNIVVTQPRRIAARSIATRVCQERGWNVGELVGYQIGMDKTAGELTRLLYCTTGVLLQKLISEKRIDNYTHIIIDEIHERNTETDLLLMVVRQFLWSQASPVRVILMSATIDSSKFIDYFTVEGRNGLPMRPCEIKITDCVRSIIKNYLDSVPLSWVSEAGNGVTDTDYIKTDINDPGMHEIRLRLCPVMIKNFEGFDKSHARRGAVLVFLPGFDDIRFMTNLLNSFAAKHNLNWLILPLHSSITLEEQQRVFIPTRLGERKIILSTNIAESSITVPEVVYVIDYCLTKSLVCDRTTNYPTLKLEWASRNSCEQRAGRCGRVQDGRVYRMVAKDFFHRYMRTDGVPELLRTPLENAILVVKMLAAGSPKKSLALCLDCPNMGDLKRSILRLKRVGALTPKVKGTYDEEDGELTFLGEMMAGLPLDVQLSKFIMLGHFFDCLEDCIIIAACLSLQNFFEKSFDDTIKSYKARLAWTEKTFSDPIAYWYAYRTFWDMVKAGMFEQHSPQAKAWCKRNYIQYPRLKDVIILVEELKKRLKASGVYTEQRPNLVRDKFEDQLILKVVIAGAFYPYYYIQTPPQCADVRKELADKNPHDTVKISNLPQNEGVLYVNQIRKALAEIDDNMELEFDCSHCYITFKAGETEILSEAIFDQTFGKPVTRSDDALYQESVFKRQFKDNSVKTAVYLALKLARHNPIFINKFKTQISDARISKLVEIRDGKINRAGHFTANRFIVSTAKKCEIPEARLPAKYEKKIDIFVTEIKDDGGFWAQFRNEQTKEMLEGIQAAFGQAFNPKRYPYLEPKVDDMILVRYDNEITNYSEVCRARVVRVEREKERFQVYFIDYGGYGLVSYDNISSCCSMNRESMPAILYNVPALAMECRMCEVKPSPGRALMPETRYSDMITLRNLVTNRFDITGMIYSVVNQVVALKLFREEDNGISLNEKLVADGLFIEFPEKPISQFDCGVRLNARKPEGYVAPLYSITECCTVEPFNAAEEEKFLQTRFINIPDCPFTKEKIKLKGPYTPIEVGFKGVSKQDSRLRVHVDNESVNSISCESDPDNSFRRLLVASAVQLQQSGNKLTVRNTTLMPDLIGLPHLMSLLFAPRVEFRVDPDNIQYLGALCGLGYDEKTKKSFDPEFDMELVFDCFIDNKDVLEINLLRYHMSEILSSRKKFSELSGQTLFKKQRDLRSKVLEILSKNRAQIPPKENEQNQFAWVDPNQMQIDEHEELGCEPVYLSHCAVANIVFEDYKEKLAENLTCLKLFLQSNVRACIHCRLCDAPKFFSRSAAQDHITSKAHVLLVKKIFEPSRWPEFEFLNEFTVPNNLP